MNNNVNWLTEIINERIEKLNDRTIEPSIVIPVNQAFSVAQKVLPKNQVQEILGKAEIIVQTECICRSKVKGCNAPKDVCIVLNTTAERYMKGMNWRKITVEEANKTLDRSAEYGLIHLALYSKGHQPEAICSCCSCCCHDLRTILDFDNIGMVLMSDYIIDIDKEKCIDCGTCIERCHFDAYSKELGKIIFKRDKCYGCGLCIMTCPVEAVKMVKR